MKVTTHYDPEHDIASLTFPVNQLDKGECSVARSVSVDLLSGRIVIDLNFKGQMLGIEILNVRETCSADMIRELLDGP